MELVFEMKERKLLFRFTTRAWWNIEQKEGSLSKLLDRMNSDERPLDANCVLLAETATAGERFKGSKETITKDWILDHMSPMQVKRATVMAKSAVTAGMRREEAEQDDGEVIDVILAEIEAEKRAKKENAARMTDRTSPQDNASDTV